MFYWDRTQIIALVIFVIMLISIPAAALLVKQTQIFKSSALEAKKTSTKQNVSGKEASSSANKMNEVPLSSPLTELKNLLEASSTPGPQGTPTPTPIVNLAFGPTLNLTVTLEGRPAGKNAGKVFLGLAAGPSSAKPTYILTFTIDFPDSGIFQGLSLAGLNPGSTYTAYVKGPAQIDTASSFVMSPTETNLNNNQAILLLTGDLNEDNAINSTDYTIAKNLYGATSASRSWNPLVDFNLDGTINNFDLAYITKNFGKIGASSTWYSPAPVSTPSATPRAGGPATYSGSPSSPSGGYWLYVP